MKIETDDRGSGCTNYSVKYYLSPFPVTAGWISFYFAFPLLAFGALSFDLEKVLEDQYPEPLLFFQLWIILVHSCKSPLARYSWLPYRRLQPAFPERSLFPLTHIGDRAFERRQLINVTIPDSVTHIGILAFSWNLLTSVTISDSVTTIGGWAFAGCRFDSVIIPKNVTSIGNRAFIGSWLTSITFQKAGTTMEKDFIDNEGNLRALYSKAGSGTYTRPNINSANWTQR